MYFGFIVGILLPYPNKPLLAIGEHRGCGERRAKPARANAVTAKQNMRVWLLNKVGLSGDSKFWI